jgi:hypothetical protein
MTNVDLGPTTVEAAGTQPRRTRRRWLLAGGVVFIVLVALAIIWWWRWLYSPHALESGGGYELGARRPVGATFYSPAMVLPDGKQPITLDVRSVTPWVVQDTSNATVKVLVCHRNDSISHMGSDDLSFCAWTKPFAPGTLTIGSDDPGTNSIILAITTTHLGTVAIDGVHVTYRQGARHGSQDTGGRIVVKAIRPAPPKPAITKPPTITALTPTGGARTGRTRIVIRGTSFTDTATVRFGTVDVTGKEVSPVSRRQLVVLAPAHVAGTVDVRVVTELGVSPIVAADRYTYR